MLDFLNQTPFDRSYRFGPHFAAQYSQPRVDGGFDYFPRGLGNPGYRIDAETQDRIREASLTVDRESGVVMLVSLIVIGVAEAVWFSISPLTRQLLTGMDAMWLASIATFSVMFVANVIGQRGMRRWTDELLRNAAIVRLSRAEHRQLVARSWVELPGSCKRLKLLSALGYVVIFAFSGNLIFEPSNASIGLSLFFTFGAIISIAAFVQLAIESIRAQIWSRSLRGRNPQFPSRA